MKLTQIRNATLLLDYAGKKFLIDPMLAKKEAWPGFADKVMGNILGDACGLVFKHPSEKTRYIAGDTVWVKPYVRALQLFQPQVVVMNTCNATNDLYGPIIMGKEDTLRMLNILPEATLGDGLTAERLQLSKVLLETTGISIEGVAEKAGFESPVSFRQRFKFRFGVSPSEWRRTFRGPPSMMADEKV